MFHLFQGPESRCSDESSTAIVSRTFGLAHVNVNQFFEFSPCHNTRGVRGHKYKLFKHQTTTCVRSIFSVKVLSTSGTPCLMMPFSTLFIGLDVVSCVLICLVTLGIVLGLVYFHFLLSILCVLLILSRLIRATISVFFRTLLSCSTVILFGFILHV